MDLEWPSLTFGALCVCFLVTAHDVSLGKVTPTRDATHSYRAVAAVSLAETKVIQRKRRFPEVLSFSRRYRPLCFARLNDLEEVPISLPTVSFGSFADLSECKSVSSQDLIWVCQCQPSSAALAGDQT
jgi:hypothetical protein